MHTLPVIWFTLITGSFLPDRRQYPTTRSFQVLFTWSSMTCPHHWALLSRCSLSSERVRQVSSSPHTVKKRRGDSSFVEAATSSTSAITLSSPLLATCIRKGPTQ